MGAVTPHGSTKVMPSASTTYTLTASGAGGSADSSVRISVSAPVSAETREPSDTRDAYFDYDSAVIRPNAREALQKSADFLKDYLSMANY